MTIYHYEKNKLELTLTEDEIMVYIDPPPGYAPIQWEVDINEEILRGMYEALKEYFDCKHFGDWNEQKAPVKILGIIRQHPVLGGWQIKHSYGANLEVDAFIKDHPEYKELIEAKIEELEGQGITRGDYYGNWTPNELD